MHGFDFAESAVANGRALADAQGLSCRFSLLDLYDDHAVSRVADVARVDHGRPRPVRPVPGALPRGRRPGQPDPARRRRSWRAGGGELFLEFRTGKDLGQEHLFGDDHFRQFIDPMVVELEIEELGGEVTYREEGCGLAAYKTEDPHVARIVAHFPARGRAEARP